jgi:hypothetical protein
LPSQTLRPDCVVLRQSYDLVVEYAESTKCNSWGGAQATKLSTEKTDSHGQRRKPSSPSRTKSSIRWLKRDGYLGTKIVLACLAAVLALARILLFDSLARRIDGTALVMLLAVPLILLLPWERLTSFKAAGVELSLDRAPVQAALESVIPPSASLAETSAATSHLRARLEALGADLQKAKGGRVFWLDPRPPRILPERRLLRALDIETVAEKDPTLAKEFLARDDDFDLIICSVADGYGDFIADIREAASGGKSKDPHLKSLNAIFYTLLPPKAAQEDTTRARITLPEPPITYTPEELLPEVIRTLAVVRSKPLRLDARKQLG